jgi:alpha-L-arabinofuranosidase
MRATAAIPLTVQHRSWPTPPTTPRMGTDAEARAGLVVTNRHLTRAGRPWIPVSGELHYSRVPRHRWAARLRQMRSGGITVVATYVFWIHHVEHRGPPRFDDNLDVAAFIDSANDAGLDVVLRIGPWAHGETRNGGFPDWVQRAPVAHRTDDPAYLALVREWFGQLATALAGRCSPDRVLAIQLENELHDQPTHLLTLKRLAREAGLSAPLWTATAWDDAELPPGDEVMPLFGGYSDGFWVDADEPWNDSFRQHFFFSHRWDDPGIGADLRHLFARQAAAERTADHTTPPSFPPVTCELAGGMATAYHRRPHPAGLDLATVAHCKIGNGSAWQGYYMYAGGTNPPGDHGMQESHATGYPNDMPRLGYDFHAPIGEAGDLTPSHAELRRQHAFLTAFGPDIAGMPSTLPDLLPTSVEDTTTLRWALRADGHSGFLFLAWHQPHVPLDTYRQARFRVVLDGDELVLPSQPVDIPPGTLARWPLGLDCHGVHLAWATATALTVLPGGVPTLVLTAQAGIPAELAVAPHTVIDGQPASPDPTGRWGVHTAVPGRRPIRLTSDSGSIDVLVLPAADAAGVWVCEDAGGERDRRLLLSNDDLSWGFDGRVEASTATRRPEVLAYDPRLRDFRPLDLETHGGTAACVEVSARLQRTAQPVPAGYGTAGNRASAPSPAMVDELSASYELALPPWVWADDQDVLLHIDWAGDVAELRVDGRAVSDRFWDGSRWTLSLRDAGGRPGCTVTLHLLPLSPDAPVHLPRPAVERRAAADGPLLALDRVHLEARGTWIEPERDAQATVRGVVNVDLPGPRISRHLYGHFAEHLGRCVYDGFFVGEDSPIPHVRGIRRDVVEALRAIAIPNLRWPGGLFADEYHWRDGIGPREQRPRLVNSHWGDVVEDNSFGTHEFMDLCELLGADPYVSANVGTGTPQEAKDWIEYLTRGDDSPMARLRRANGRDEPWTVPFWGLGNEPWGGGGNMRPEYYADLARVFGTYSKDHGDNRLYRIAAGADAANYRWTEVLMQALGRSFASDRDNGVFQGISLHYYTLAGPWESKGGATGFDLDRYYTTMANAARVEDLIATHSAIMDAYDPDKKVGLVLDEWGTWFDVEPGTNPGFLFQQNTLRDALVAGVHFDVFHRHADRLVMANIAQTVNVLQAMLLTDGKALIRTPTYHVFAMNAGHHDARSLAVELRTPAPVRMVGDRRLTTLSASASRKDGRVLVSLSNLDAESGVDVELDLRGAGRLGEPEARILTAATLDAHNTADSPDAITPQPFDGARLEGTVLRVTLPRHAFVTVALSCEIPEVAIS